MQPNFQATPYFLLIVLCLSFSQLSAQCLQLVWSDEFDGTSLDLTKWTPMTGDGCDINLCGWGNNELQWYQAQNATVNDGTLKITARQENVGGKRYTSARLRTFRKAEWTYGRFEARIKLPTGKGLWPAFWMLPTDEIYGFWPQSGEIDIMELIGSEPATAHGTIHFGQPVPNNRSTGNKFDLNEGIFNDNFHVFAVEWEPNVIRWYVDDFLYVTKTNLDVAPSRWPFDQRFHFLLNVAVGGNWPGAPDFSTSFPQVMEVDYVRVYSGGRQPHLGGRRSVANQSKGETYFVGNAPAGTSFNWILPAGATLVSGQGTSRVQIDWGNTGGELIVEIGNGCGSRQLKLDVFVEPALVPALVLENFDDPGRITFSSSTGTLTDNFANPGANEINSSALCGRYARNGTQQFDVLVYKTTAIPNAGDFVSKKKKFFIDVYTNAPVGTPILLQLENSSQARATNYPVGRHSRYEVRTTKQNQWERLEIPYLDRPDGNVSNQAIDQLIFLFGTNSLTSNTYYFDNFTIYEPGSTTGIFSPSPVAGELKVFPNPAHDRLWVSAEREIPLQSLIVSDLSGRIWGRVETAPDLRLEVDLSDLPPGMYTIKAIDRKGGLQIGRFLKN